MTINQGQGRDKFHACADPCVSYAQASIEMQVHHWCGALEPNNDLFQCKAIVHCSVTSVENAFTSSAFLMGSCMPSALDLREVVLISQQKLTWEKSSTVAPTLLWCPCVTTSSGSLMN